MEKNILEVNNLRKQFGKFVAVNDITFAVKEGEVLGLLGPNGAGKTTTIQMLLNVLIPTSGNIRYFGKELSEHREEILRQINFASTYISLPWQFTVHEILDIFGRLYDVKDRSKRIQTLLRAFEIDRLEKRNFYKLSAGEKTRVVLAKAFLNYPRVVLLDEPTASLDPEIAVKVREFLQKEKHEYNVSMLLTSHNMDEVEELCQNVIIINHGKIIAHDTPERLAKNISDCEIRISIRKHQDQAEKLLHGMHLSFSREDIRFTILLKEEHIADLLIKLASKKIDYHEVTINKPELEDYFLQLIGDTYV